MLTQAEIDHINPVLVNHGRPPMNCENQSEWGFDFNLDGIHYYVPHYGGPADFISEIAGFHRGSVDALDIVNHYIPIEHALTTLADQKIYLRPIIAQSDDREFEYCYTTVGANTPLTIRERTIRDECLPMRIVGNDVYIFSSTTSDTATRRFWQEYAGGNYTGAKIRFRIRIKSPDYINLATSGPGVGLCVSKVMYDDGDLFEPYNQFRTALEVISIATVLPHFAALAPLVKRRREYDWESEVRILIDTAGSTADLENGHDIKYLRRVAESRSQARAVCRQRISDS